MTDDRMKRIQGALVEDGQMAYVVVHKRVHLTARDSSGATVAERTRYAWLSVYEKQRREWRLSAIASTDRPDSR